MAVVQPGHRKEGSGAAPVVDAITTTVRDHRGHAPGMIRPVVRIAATCLVPAATLAVLAGCGKSKPASVGPPPAPLLTAQAVADVGAIMLRQSDVPGMSAASNGGETAAGDLSVELPRCGAALPSWEAGSFRSAMFEPQPLSRLEAVWSAIRVVPNPTVAVRRLAANRSARARACVARVFGAVLAQPGPLVRERTSVSPLPTELHGVEGSFGLRLTHRVTYLEANPRPPEHNPAEKHAQIEGERGNFSLDVLGFAAGRLEITLMDLHAPGVAPVQSERRLLSLLYSRAKAHELELRSRNSKGTMTSQREAIA